MKAPISVIILTYNEEIHIERLLKNIADFADEIFIVDSYSTDKTLEIAKKYGVKIIQHEFENQAQQFNWALDNLEIKNEWILRLDADEYLTPELKKEIKENFSATVNGYYMKRRVYFMGRWIKHGGYYPTWILRLFRKGKARSEQRKIDEHIVLLEGKTGRFKNDFADENKKDLTFWIEKHNNYSSKEATDVLIGNYGRGCKKYYYRLPIFFRVCVYFCYRYFIRLGFLDGKEGLIFHFLQGFWYRFLVDAKIYEKRKINKNT
ncbi:MAG: glycosyltransferase family 2 protein [Patescibacteria group bacterium]